MEPVTIIINLCSIFTPRRSHQLYWILFLQGCIGSCMCWCSCFTYRAGKCFYRNTIITGFICRIYSNLTLNSVYGNSVAGLFPNQLVYILYHFSICAKVEFITIYIFPSGCHGTVCAKVIPASINSLP